KAPARGPAESERTLGDELFGHRGLVRLRNPLEAGSRLLPTLCRAHRVRQSQHQRPLNGWTQGFVEMTGKLCGNFRAVLQFVAGFSSNTFAKIENLPIFALGKSFTTSSL